MTDLWSQLAVMTGFSRQWFWVAALVFLRVGSAMALMPAFGERVVPARVRLALTLAFSAVIGPAVAEDLLKVQGVLQPAAVEVLVGLAIGIGLRLFIVALEMAASIVAQVSSLSQLFGGSTPEPQPAIGNLLTMASLALAVLSGLHIKVASLMILSYRILPAGHFPGTADMAEWGLQQVVHASVLAFSLAAPFVIGSVIYNVALGIINKAMPQLAVSMVGAPLLTAGSMILMMIAVPLILGVWLSRFDAFMANPFLARP